MYVLGTSIGRLTWALIRNRASVSRNLVQNLETEKGAVKLGVWLYARLCATSDLKTYYLPRLTNPEYRKTTPEQGISWGLYRGIDRSLSVQDLV